MKITLIAGPLAGLVTGYLLCAAVVRAQRSRARRKKQPDRSRNGLLQSVTRFLFVTTQAFALGWVTWTYVIASYSTIALLQPFPAEELSREAVRTILGVGFLKVLENIFEHNEGRFFGRSSGGDRDTNDESGGAG